MAAANRKKQSSKKPSSGGGALMGMRSGMKRVAGQGKKKRKKGQPATFGQVFGWVGLVFLIGILIWAMSR